MSCRPSRRRAAGRWGGMPTALETRCPSCLLPPVYVPRCRHHAPPVGAPTRLPCSPLAGSTAGSHPLRPTGRESQRRTRCGRPLIRRGRRRPPPARASWAARGPVEPAQTHGEWRRYATARTRAEGCRARFVVAAGWSRRRARECGPADRRAGADREIGGGGACCSARCTPAALPRGGAVGDRELDRPTRALLRRPTTGPPAATMASSVGLKLFWS